jgi:hypothetical protein
MRAWTLLVIKTCQLLSERESQSAMIICRVCARRFFQFPVMFTNNKKWRSTSWLTMFYSLFSFPTFLLFSPFRLVRSNTWVQWKHLTPEHSIDLCLQTFHKLLLLLVPKVTTRSLYPECIANLKLPIDAFYQESRSGVNIAKRNITTGLFRLGCNWPSGFWGEDFFFSISSPLFSNLHNRSKWVMGFTSKLQGR